MSLIPPVNLDANSETDPVSDRSRRTFLAGLGILLGSGLVAAPLMATAARWTEPPPVPVPSHPVPRPSHARNPGLRSSPSTPRFCAT